MCPGTDRLYVGKIEAYMIFITSYPTYRSDENDIKMHLKLIKS